jgi:hypothetical protein
MWEWQRPRPTNALFSHDLCFKIIYFSIHQVRISRAPPYQQEILGVRIQEELSLRSACRIYTHTNIYADKIRAAQNAWCARIIYQKHTSMRAAHTQCVLCGQYRCVVYKCVHAGMGEDNIQWLKRSLPLLIIPRQICGFPLVCCY